MKKDQDNRINLRLNSQNWKNWDTLENFFRNDPYLKAKVKSKNDMLNYIVSTFLLLYVNSTEKNYKDREEELLGKVNNYPDVVEEMLQKINRKLTYIDDKSQKNNYMLLGMFNRSTVSLDEGGSIFSPDTPNFKLNLKLDEVLANDIHSNQVRNQRFNR